MRVLVIGGTRFIGPYVVRRLHALGHVVTVVHSGRTEPSFDPAIGHIHEPSLGWGKREGMAALADAFRGFGPDVVLDMVAFSEQDARILLESIRGAARRVVAVSSADVYRAYGVLHRKEPG